MVMQGLAIPRGQKYKNKDKSLIFLLQGEQSELPQTLEWLDLLISNVLKVSD